MLKDLERAAQAYAEAQAAVAGARQVDVMHVSGYSREQIRRILRAAGVEPAGNG